MVVEYCTHSYYRAPLELSIETKLIVVPENRGRIAIGREGFSQVWKRDIYSRRVHVKNA